jgi:hypothetical protein
LQEGSAKESVAAIPKPDFIKEHIKNPMKATNIFFLFAQACTT